MSINDAADIQSELLKWNNQFRFERLGASVFCSDAGFYFNAYVPAGRELQFSGIFMFHEPGLYEAMPTLGNDDMLEAIAVDKWRDKTPFLVGAVDERCFLQIGNVRIGVPKTSRAEFGYGMSKLSDVWHHSVQAIDRVLETRGCQYVDEQSGVILGRINATFWQRLLECTRAHDVNNVTSLSKLQALVRFLAIGGSFSAKRKVSTEPGQLHLRGIALQRKHVYHPVENHGQEVATGCIAGALRRDRTAEAKARIAGANARPAEGSRGDAICPSQAARARRADPSRMSSVQ